MSLPAGQPLVGSAVIGSRTPEALRASFGALDVELTAAEASWLNLEAGDA